MLTVAHESIGTLVEVFYEYIMRYTKKFDKV